MRALRKARAGRGARARHASRLALALLASALAVGCDDPFEPFQDNQQGPFSMFGYLDLAADTQWVRVTPVRQTLLADPAPVDAVVTLENLESGRTVTLTDSVFEFRGGGVEGVAYVHNFWTTEPLEAGATYALRATRSDGAGSTALVEMPDEAEVELSYYEGPPEMTRDGPLHFRNVLRIHVRGEHLLYADVVYQIRDFVETPARDSLVVHQFPNEREPGTFEFSPPSALTRNGVLDLGRREARFAVASSDWPYRPGLSPTEAALPGSAPSNVENGFGFVGGLATWTVPLPRCNPVEPRPGGEPACGHVLDDTATSVTGRVVDSCGRPKALADVELVERFPGGGSAIFRWRTGRDGGFEFEGLVPGAELELEIQDVPETLRLPRLAPGERHVVKGAVVSTGCGPGISSLPLP